MGINRYKIKKWFKMLFGKSLLHVNQDVGKEFVPGEIRGYFNDLTEKVTKDPDTLNKQILPQAKDENGNDIIFATTVFQYGLGCYDLLLQRNDGLIEKQLKRCLQWAVENQDDNGGWNICSFAGKLSPYGAMAQGEGVSLLIRGYLRYGNVKYLDTIEKGIKLLVRPLEEFGTSLYKNNELFLLEFMDLPCVLNGWIFAIFGLYDYVLFSKNKKYEELLNITVRTLINHVDDFDIGYWSKYDNCKMISSPFYHKLHISQLKALVTIYNDDKLLLFLEKLIKYQNNPFCRTRAFIIKVFQKIFFKDN